MTDEEKAAAEKAEADRKAADQKAAEDKAAADKAEADRKAREAETSNAGHRTPNAEGVEKAMKDLTGERDTLQGTVTALTAERDAAVKERDAFKAEVDRLEKLTGKAAKPTAAGGSGYPPPHAHPAQRS